ncbi:putative DNA polymerase POL4 [Aspergillus heteromorphus CBS 117.55]|uniref:DNA polymerase n=1 Tax=Aspergillus heteromorphus CBS 117.55 TaxID=1448321 RepID=A0A317W5S9_9EURO|nr:putative DNA polymerase POL4 [Aspergillus heteromorphus CBS 117.55]PWY81956.1 putative DNA polymerase POL4 [Aspergillus heteromorphus CBS 117.55]
MAPSIAAKKAFFRGLDRLNEVAEVRSISTDGMTSNPRPTSGKRKRQFQSVVIPEQHQIFRGLVFFFFPNNDVSSLRRLRIQRAQDYGAFWERTWGDNVTHVIVDKGLTFQDVLKHLSLETFPADVALVDESYPSECVKFRSVLSATQTRFRVNGAAAPKPNEDLPANEPSSIGSLTVKPAKKEQHPRTPSQRSESEHGDEIPEKGMAEPPGKGPVVPEPDRERDALDDMIEEAKAVKHLPLELFDSHDEETAAEASDSDASDSSECRQPEKKMMLGKYEAADAWQQKFACMQKHDSKSNAENPNTRTIAVLQQMLDYYTRTDDHWRTIAYRKAISALRRQSKKIVTKSQALAIPGIGTRLADKIEEIVFTNRLRRLENASATSEDHILQLFLGVYGAGITQASRWLAQGYRSLEDLKTKAPLSQQQRVGVERYYDFSQRIPRREVEEHGAIVRRAVQKSDPEMQVIIGGSYRRGTLDSGDVDLIITKPEATIEQIRTLMIETVVPGLFRQGFLQASLATTSLRDGSKWHGASKLPDGRLWRRIDLLFVPDAEIGAALIYFTGNDIFNRSMRLLASKKGMRLNQRGLYTDVLRGPQRVKLTAGRLVEGREERRIFAILGVPWRPPEHRIC